MRRGSWLLLGVSVVAAGCGGSVPSRRASSASLPRHVERRLSVSPRVLSVETAESIERTSECPWSEEASECTPRDVACGADPKGGCDLSRLWLWAALRWREDVDLDLYVRTPEGAWIGAVAPWAAGGGRLLRQGRGGCAAHPARAHHSEWVGWDAGGAPPVAGVYEVWVYFRGACGRSVGEVRAWMALGSSERGWGPWRLRLTAGERVRAATMRLPREGLEAREAKSR